MDGGVLMETLELAYDAVEMTAATAASDKR
jgi:hypothetical protein